MQLARSGPRLHERAFALEPLSGVAADWAHPLLGERIAELAAEVRDPRAVHGDTDVLSASEFDDEIAWYENTDGAGSFGAQQVITTLADGAEFVAAADIDGDGDTDVVSGSRMDGRVAWYENLDGLGSFGPQQTLSTLVAGARSAVPADLDGDGDLDVLSASYDDDEVLWFEQLNVADPLDDDTDDDGILDGTEIGLTAPQGTGTDPGVFVPDADPGTTTDPLVADSDGDGLSDGDEDVNANGMVDSGETDPGNPDTDGDGAIDGDEVAAGSNPLDPLSLPPFQVPALGGWELALLGALVGGLSASRLRRTRTRP